jgi:hypothetical protein
VPDMNMERGVGWAESKLGGKFFLSNQLAEIWFQRLLDEIVKS